MIAATTLRATCGLLAMLALAQPPAFGRNSDAIPASFRAEARYYANASGSTLLPTCLVALRNDGDRPIRLQAIKGRGPKLELQRFWRGRPRPYEADLVTPVDSLIVVAVRDSIFLEILIPDYNTDAFQLRLPAAGYWADSVSYVESDTISLWSARYVDLLPRDEAAAAIKQSVPEVKAPARSITLSFDARFGRVWQGVLTRERNRPLRVRVNAVTGAVETMDAGLPRPRE